MIYRITVDGNDIYGGSDDLALISPKVSIALNEGGSASFTMSIHHKYYNTPILLTSDIDIYEDNKLIWFGRVIEQSMSMNRDKEFTCEGAFAFLNDSIQRPRTFTDTHLSDIISSIMSAHNTQVPENRQIIFDTDSFTIPDVETSWSIDYSTSKTAISSLMDYIGGYIMFKKENGVIYMSWLLDLPSFGSQPIQFGLNLVDISKKLNGAGIVTSIIPLGKEIDGERLTIAEENDGLDYLDSDYVDKYGRITRIVEFSEVGTAVELKTAAQRWLENNSPDSLCITCNAAELYFLDGNFAPFMVGQYVLVTSEPHDIHLTLPIVGMEIDMETAVKTISIGTSDDQKISSISIE